MQGLRFVWNQKVIRWSALLITVYNFCSNASFPVWLFLIRDQLHYSPGLIGIILACAAIGGILGSIVAGRLGKRFGMVPIALLTMLTGAVTFIVFSFIQTAWVFAIGQGLLGGSAVINNVNLLTLRQSVTPDEMLGRMNSVVRLIAWSFIPVGALVGTALVEPLGSKQVLLLINSALFVVAATCFRFIES